MKISTERKVTFLLVVTSYCYIFIFLLPEKTTRPVSNLQELKTPIKRSFSFNEIFNDDDRLLANSIVNDDVRSSTTHGSRASNHSAPVVEPPDSKTWLKRSSMIHPRPDKSSRDIVIPKIINKIYFEMSGGFPTTNNTAAVSWQNIKRAHESWGIMNPEYDIRYFSLDLAREYLDDYFHPKFLRAFDCLEAFASKADLFRLALLYREGGWHSDWKQTCLKLHTLNNLAAKRTELFFTYDAGNYHGVKEECIQNGFLGAIPGHPFIARTITSTFKNIQSRNYGKIALQNAGGPCELGEAMKAYEKELGTTDPKVKIGIFSGHYFWEDTKIILYKCPQCGSNQDWEKGNNYNELHAKRMFYCQDATSILN